MEDTLHDFQIHDLGGMFQSALCVTIGQGFWNTFKQKSYGIQQKGGFYYMT